MSEFRGTRLRARVLSPVDAATVTWWPDAVVTVEPPLVVSVAPYGGGPVDEDLRPAVLVPGFVDAHLHFPQTAIIGRASGPLLNWLQWVTFPEEGRFADRRYAEEIAVRFCRALASAGTTRALVYGPVFAEAMDVLFAVAEARNQALVGGPVLMDVDVPTGLRVDDPIGALAGLVERWHGRAGHEVAVLPRFALSCSAEMMAAAATLASTHDLVVSTHLSENTEEVRLVRERFGAGDYLEVYERAGLLRPGAVFAHAVHLSDGEWGRLAVAGAHVAHCPDSNNFLGSGDMPIDRARAYGVSVAVGTDVAAGRTFRIPRILSAMYDNALRRGVELSPTELFWIGTRGDAVGRRDVGFVRAGFRADLCAFPAPPEANDGEAVLASLLFDHDAPPMSRMWVDGIPITAS